MPHIYDNIDQHLLPALRQVLNDAEAADFAVGYFNLRGWRALDDLVERFAGGDGNGCRLLVGMQRLPEEDLKDAQRFVRAPEDMDNRRAVQLRKRLADEFRRQITFGAPTNQDEAGLRRLARQLRSGKLHVKLFLSHTLHAKLYLVRRSDVISPLVGYVGSSNLTMSGLQSQGELNVDVVDSDAALKLAKWFNDRWEDRWSLDISEELARIIDESWARESLIPPYHIYIKMAYHLSQEARAGQAEFKIPGDLDKELFEFQRAAVKIAAHHLNKRDGVLLGDVVGLGKTMMATAVARIFEEDRQQDTLILCPKNLVPMWQDYADRYRLRAKVMPTSQVERKLSELRHYGLVILDESHNQRNREGKRYKVIQDYIQRSSPKVMLLSATPYNKSYLDLSSQLRLFLAPDVDLGIRPEALLRKLEQDNQNFSQFQIGVRTLAAFERSNIPDDWRELMRLYMVRRTRSFVQENYAATDEHGRKYLTMGNGSRAYFPSRQPHTARFTIDEADSSDQYARLYSAQVVDIINSLQLPRYGLGNFVAKKQATLPTPQEQKILDDLSRAGKRLMGFCRTNLFKRLESSGAAFIQSVERHILRNYVVLHAIEKGLDIPIGTQDAGLMDTRVSDQDELEFDSLAAAMDADTDADMDGDAADDAQLPADLPHSRTLRTDADFRTRAAEIYAVYRTTGRKRFKWLRPGLLTHDLAVALTRDSADLISLLNLCGAWDPHKDAKLAELTRLLRGLAPHQKALIFTQFADTVAYLEDQLRRRNIPKLGGATGNAEDPTALAWRFSPVSNGKRDKVLSADELNVLVATDVLSEGQNLQDCAVVINYDMPWAIIRLIQRVGRVDRIGQSAETIECYSFLPADGVERLINLRRRLADRLRANAEVVGTDEAFFEGDDSSAAAVRDLYNEKAGILDGEPDNDVDLASYAFQIWKNATDADPSLRKTIEAMQPEVYSAKRLADAESRVPPQPGVLTYVRTAQENDALIWLNDQGAIVTASQLAILEAARCTPDTPALPRSESHHQLVTDAVRAVLTEESSSGGSLGRPSGARYKTYQRLKRHRDATVKTLFHRPELDQAIDDIYRYPLRQLATDALNRQLRSDISDADLAELVLTLREEGRLCVVQEADDPERDPQIICSMGLI